MKLPMLHVRQMRQEQDDQVKCEPVDEVAEAPVNWPRVEEELTYSAIN